MKTAGFGIVFIQLLDIILHAATNQLEPLRVASNLVILLWLAVIASGRLKLRSRLLSVAAVSGYLLLNLIFLALEGVTNPQQGGALRLSLFGLVSATVLLSGLFMYWRETKS